MNCKNCLLPLLGPKKYCSNCGARTINQRINLNYLFTLVSQRLFNWEEGFWLTLRSMYTNPCKVISEFLSGTRKKFYDPFAFYAIWLGVYVFLLSFFKDEFNEMASGMHGTVGNSTEGQIELIKKINTIIAEKSGMISYITFPFYALISYVVFRFKKFNFAEHLVINLYIQAAVFPVSILLFSISLLTGDFIWQFVAALTTIVINFFMWKNISQLSWGHMLIRFLYFLVLASIIYVLIIFVVVILFYLFLALTGDLMPFLESLKAEPNN